MTKKQDNGDKKTKAGETCESGLCEFKSAAMFADGGVAGDVLEMISGNGDGKPEKPEIPPAENFVPKIARISERCAEIGYLIGPAVKELDSRSLEAGGFFAFNEGDNSFGFAEFIVPKDLEITSASVRFAEQYPNAGYEIEAMSKRDGTKLLLGAMFHVHPKTTFGLTHSSIDDDELPKLVNKMAKVTRKVIESPYLLIEDRIKKEIGDKGIVLRGDALSDFVKEVIFPDDKAFFALLQEYKLNPDPKRFSKKEFLAKLLDMIDDNVYEPRTINFAWSFVFDDSRSLPYAEIGFEETFRFTEDNKGHKLHRYSTIKNIPVEVFSDGKHIPTKEEVEKLCKERIKFPAKPTVWKGWGKKAGKTSAAPYYSGYGGEYYTGYTAYYATSTTGMTVEDRINLLITPSMLKKRESPETDNDQSNQVLDSIINGESTGPGKPKTQLTDAEKRQIDKQLEKTDKTTYFYDEIAGRFVLSALLYISDCRHSSCRYSTYLDSLLELLGEYRTETEISKEVELLKNQRKKSDKAGYLGLRTSVIAVGDIVEDNPEVVEKHESIKSDYALKRALYSIWRELTEFEDKESIQFMFAFTDAKDSAERSTLLEKYVGYVHGRYKSWKSEKKQANSKNGIADELERNKQFMTAFMDAKDPEKSELLQRYQDYIAGKCDTLLPSRDKKQDNQNGK